MAQVEEIETADEVIRETRRIKEDLARMMGFDIDRILQDAREKQKGSGRVIFSPPAHQSA